MTADATRPLLLGYIRAHILMTDEEIAAAKDTLVTYASTEGFALGTVYVEHASTAPAAFHALLDEVRRDNDVWAVAVPTPHHLAVGGRQAMRRDLEHHGSVHVLVVQASP
jgi:rhamnogalacturonyl hydrolase YesR